MLLRQAQESQQHPHALDAPLCQHLLGPLLGLRPDALDLAQQPGRPPLDAADLLRQDMRLQRGEASRRTAGRARRWAASAGRTAAPAGRPTAPRPPGPDTPAAPSNRPPAPARARRDAPSAGPRWNRSNRAAGSGSQAPPSPPARTALPTCWRVVPWIRVSATVCSHSSRCRFSSAREAKRAALEGIVLDVVDAALDLALVPGRVGFGGQNGQSVVLGKRPHLGAQLRIEPVRPAHRGTQIVDHQGLTARRQSGRRRSPGSAGSHRWSGDTPPRCSPCGCGSARCGTPRSSDAAHPDPPPERPGQSPPAPRRRGRTPSAAPAAAVHAVSFFTSRRTL